MRFSRMNSICFTVSFVLAASLTLPLFSQPVHAGTFADLVVSYDPGSTPVAGLTDPNAALGRPDDVSGEVLGFPNVLSPFSPAFEADELVSIGEGGHLTLRLRDDAFEGPGREIGVVTNSGLVDLAFPTGTTGTPASTFGSDSAVVEVSANGSDFVALNGGAPILFDLPSVFYQNAGPFDSSAPAMPVLSDFGMPFEGMLSDFDGLTYGDIIALLGGSGGGTWLDLAGSGLASARFVRFSVPDDGNAGTSNNFEIDALLVSTQAAPEPALLVLLAASGLCVAVRRMR